MLDCQCKTVMYGLLKKLAWHTISPVGDFTHRVGTRPRQWWFTARNWFFERESLFWSYFCNSIRMEDRYRTEISIKLRNMCIDLLDRV